MLVDERQLEDFIADAGLVDKDELSEIRRRAEKNGTRLSDELVNSGKMTTDDVRRIKAHILGIPFVDLKDIKIDFDVLSLVPEPVARNYNIVAFRKHNDAVEVAMLDTNDLTALEFVRKKTGLKVLPRLTDEKSIKNALLQYQKSLKAEFGDLIQQDAESLKSIPEENNDEVDPRDLKKLAEDLPVIRIVDTLLKHAILQNASDIHIEPMENELLVRYRIDGILHDAMVLPKSAANSVVARIKVLSNLKLDEKRMPQDGRFKIEVSGERVSFRVSTLPTYFGEKTVLRLLRETSSGFTLEALGFHGEALERIHHGMKQRTGMLLTTGPTGSGKTTTLYTMIDILNTPEVNISTIEDPIEYQMPRVNQTQVRPEINFTFSSGLRTLLRQDPDIIMVGEIRDKETASLAINASLTGHLVLSTLHTNSAAGALPRLVDMGIEPFLIVSTVNVIIAQRLVRKLCASKEKYFLSKAGIDTLARSVDLQKVLDELKKEKVVPNDATWSKIPFWKPRPTPEHKDGYAGRLGIYEVLKVTPSIKELIMHGGTTMQIEIQARNEGMLTMAEDGIFKAVQGITTIEEVFRVISEQE
jgi:type IV pilus assembly protein PilB